MPYLKNKYTIAITVFLVYSLFLDDVDVFTIARQNAKLDQLESNKNEVAENLNQTQETLEKLESPDEVERYAREHKLFKKDDEDVFVISYE